VTALDELHHALVQAGGSDPALDARLVETLGVPQAGYTASVEACRHLTANKLPGWRLHLGYGVSGVFPYAALTDGQQRRAAEAPTVPLAILRALLATLCAGQPN